MLRTIIAHETMHCAALHHTRRDGRDPKRWNIACDHAINPLLAEAGFEMPDGALLDPVYAGLSAEEIYARLPHGSGGDGDQQDQQDSGNPGGMGGVTDPPPGGDQAGDGSGEPGILESPAPARPRRRTSPGRRKTG